MKGVSLKVNAIMNALLTISSVIFPLVTFPYVSRILMPSGTGKVSLATSVIQYFNMFAQLGIPTYGITACARARDDRMELSRITHELFAISIATSLVSYFVLALSLLFVPRFNREKGLYIVISFTIFLTAIGMEWMYKGLEQYKYITIRSITFKLISIAAMFLLIHNEKDYVIYGGITVFASSGSLVMNFINAKKYIYMKPVGGYQAARHLKPILVFFAMACATTIYVNLDSVMLGFMKGDEEVAFYNVAVKVRTLLLHVVTSLGAVLLPRTTYYIEHKLYDEFYKIGRKIIHFVILLSVPLFFYFVLFAEDAVLILAGKQYLSAVIPMQIVMTTLLFAGISNITGIQMLIPLGKEKIVLYSEIAGAFVDLCLNAVLIPRLASVGAAIGTLVAEMVVLVFQYLALQDKLSAIFKSISYFKIIISLAASSILTLLAGGLIPNTIIRFCVTGVLFFCVYGGMLLLTREKTALDVVTPIYEKIFRRRLK